jgi:predicted nucleic acid-binding protein
MAEMIVSNTGPLISLEKITGGYELFAKLFDRILIPPVVLQEVSEGMGDPEQYLRDYGIAELIEVRPVSVQRNRWNLNDCTQVKQRLFNLQSNSGCRC